MNQTNIFKCHKCGHIQHPLKKTLKKNYMYWKCSVCWSYSLMPEDFRGTNDNRRKAYKKRYKWFKDNIISPSIRMATGKGI